jgi:hypothetical protein
MPIRGCLEIVGILFNKRNRFQCVRYPDEVGRCPIPSRVPLNLRNLGTVRELLAVSRKAVSVCGHHRGISDDRLDAVFRVTDGNNLPVFVSAEVGKREPIRHLDSVLVLRRNGFASQDGEHYGNGRACCAMPVVAVPKGRRRSWSICSVVLLVSTGFLLDPVVHSRLRSPTV